MQHYVKQFSNAWDEQKKATWKSRIEVMRTYEKNWCDRKKRHVTFLSDLPNLLQRSSNGMLELGDAAPDRFKGAAVTGVFCDGSRFNCDLTCPSTLCEDIKKAGFDDDCQIILHVVRFWIFKQKNPIISFIYGTNDFKQLIFFCFGGQLQINIENRFCALGRRSHRRVRMCSSARNRINRGRMKMWLWANEVPW